MRIKHKRVAFFLGYGWVNISTPPLMTAAFLASQGFQVDIFAPASAFCDNMGVGRVRHESPGIRYFYYDKSSSAPPAALADGTPIPGSGWDAVRLAEAQGASYDWAIGFDAAGLFSAAAFSGKRGLPYIYHNLEIEERTPWKALESICQKKALYSITQDKARAEILARLNQADRHLIFAAPNSSIGDTLPQKDNYFRELFPRIGARSIVLACGSLLDGACIDRIAPAARSWPKEYVLALHGWLPDPALKTQVEALARAGDNIFLSQDLLPPAEKFRIFQAADICLTFFNPTNLNLRYAAGSAGKYYDSLRCGLPLVGNDIPGMKALLDDAGCGITVPDAAGIGAVLPTISQYYAGYRENCLKRFPRYEFSKIYADILKMTLNLIQRLPA